MAGEPVLHIVGRAEHGKGAAGRLRRTGRVPGGLFGHGEPESVSLDATEFRKTVTPDQYGALIVKLVRDEQEIGAALVKGVQVDTLQHAVLNVDLQRVSMDERVSVSVPIELTGEPAGTRLGAVLDQTLRAVNLRCRVSDVPTLISYDVSELGIGENIHIQQLDLPAECDILDNPEEVVAVMLSPTVPLEEERMEVEAVESGPELTGQAQQEDFPSER